MRRRRSRAAARRREVLLVTPGGLSQRGGMGRNMSNLVAAWDARPDGPSWRVVDSWPVEWRLRLSPVSPLYFLRALLTVLASRLTGHLGLLHIHMAGGGSVPRKGLLVWLGWCLGVPVIVHLAAADIDAQFDRLPAPARALLRQTLRRARFVVVLGSYWRDFFVERVGVEPARVVVIPNGVPDPGPPPPPRPDGGGPCRLLFLGRLGVRKGTPEVLEALADPRLARLDWRAAFAGDGAVDEMRRMAEELGLGDRAEFLGWADRGRVHGLLSASDILLLPSRQEGLPVAVLEGMAYGLAIVTTRAGAIADAVVDGENGLLVPIGDARALADALARLLADPDLRRRLQQGARRRFESDFNAALFAERFLTLYRACGVANDP